MEKRVSDDCGIPGYLLWRAANLWQKKVRSVLSPFDITPVQYLLLVGLRNLQEETGGPVKAGMIDRHAHAADGRAFAVNLSVNGAKLLARAEPEISHTDSQFHDPLGSEKEMFGDALRLLSGVRPRRRVKAVRG